MSDKGISLTKAAVEHFKRVLLEAPGVRLSITKVGCSGMGYHIAPLVGIPSLEDYIFPNDGIQVVVDKASFAHLQGTELDFIEAGMGGHLKFNNPNVQNECGCGESFNVNE